MNRTILIAIVTTTGLLVGTFSFYQYHDEESVTGSETIHVPVRQGIRNKRASPGALICAAIQFGGHPGGALSLCGAYLNNPDFNESTIMTPDEYCNAECPDATCKNRAYCDCPSPNAPRNGSGCFSLAGQALQFQSANVAACQVFCYAENKTAYSCPTTVPQQFPGRFCLCADPPSNITLPDLARRRRHIESDIDFRSIENTQQASLSTTGEDEQGLWRPRRSLLPVLPPLLTGLLQPLLDSLQKILNLLAPLSNLVCSTIVSVDDPLSPVNTCFNVGPAINATVSCETANGLLTPQCQCQQICPGNSTECASPGQCVCRNKPLPGKCVPAPIGSHGTVCRGLCSAGQTAYVCVSIYCACYVNPVLGP